VCLRSGEGGRAAGAQAAQKQAAAAHEECEALQRALEGSRPTEAAWEELREHVRILQVRTPRGPIAGARVPGRAYPHMQHQAGHPARLLQPAPVENQDSCAGVLWPPPVLPLWLSPCALLCYLPLRPWRAQMCTRSGPRGSALEPGADFWQLASQRGGGRRGGEGREEGQRGARIQAALKESNKRLQAECDGRAHAAGREDAGGRRRAARRWALGEQCAELRALVTKLEDCTL